MSLSKISLKPSLRLTAATLALTLAGCGGNPPAYESASQSAPASSIGQLVQRARAEQLLRTRCLRTQTRAH